MTQPPRRPLFIYREETEYLEISDHPLYVFIKVNAIHDTFFSNLKSSHVSNPSDETPSL